MTENRLRDIALDMELPLNRLDYLDTLLDELVEKASTERSSMLYVLLQRNLSPDLQELRKLWGEFFALAVEKNDKPPLEAVKE